MSGSTTGLLSRAKGSNKGSRFGSTSASAHPHALSSSHVSSFTTHAPHAASIESWCWCKDERSISRKESQTWLENVHVGHDHCKSWYSFYVAWGSRCHTTIEKEKIISSSASSSPPPSHASPHFKSSLSRSVGIPVLSSNDCQTLERRFHISSFLICQSDTLSLSSLFYNFLFLYWRSVRDW